MGRFSYASIVVWFFPTRLACMITNPSSATLKAAVSTKVMNVSRKLRAQQGRCGGGCGCQHKRHEQEAANRGCLRGWPPGSRGGPRARACAGRQAGQACLVTGGRCCLKK